MKILGKISLVFMFMLLIAFPVFSQTSDLPKPSGTYSVGTMRMSFADQSRKGIFTKDPEEYRELAVQVWYPSTDAFQGKQPLRYIPNRTVSKYIAKRLGIPNIFGKLTQVRTNSYLNARLAAGVDKYPVILFSVGYGGIGAENTIQMEELASHGYVVFSISHTYEDIASIFPDGKIVYFNPEQMKSFMDELMAVGKQIKANKPQNTVKYGVEYSKTAYKSVHIWSDDTSFVADQIEKLANGEIRSIFANRLDIANMGVFGHSFGGATAGQVCITDNLFKAFINMDGTPFGDIINTQVKQPFMIIHADRKETPLTAGYSTEQKNYMVVYIKGTTHSNFMDFSLLFPSFRYIGMFGKIDGKRNMRIVNDYVLSFFNKYLKGMAEPLIDQKLFKYPEVTVESR
jgi:predicted dienelactone hydrolase